MFDHMKNKLFFLLAFLAFGFASCEKESESKEPGTIDINFDNVAIVNGTQTQLSMATAGSTTYTYTNGMSQTFNVTLLRYFISAIELTGPNGEYFKDEVSVSAAGSKGYYLIDESKSASQYVTLNDVPAGEYNKLTFTVGVDSTGVVDGAAGGMLDPATNKMFWNWNSGYIAVKFEGQSPVSNSGITGSESLAAGAANGIVYHVGGWKNQPGTAFVYNNKRLSFTFDTNVKVDKDRNPEVHMVFDMLKLFKGTKTIDFTGNHNVHKPADGVDVANNIPAAFAFDHVHQ